MRKQYHTLLDAQARLYPYATVTSGSATLKSLGSVRAFLLWLDVRQHKNRALVEDAPFDLWTWMIQAVAESSEMASTPNDYETARKLTEWDISIANGRAPRLEKRYGDRGHYLTLLGKTQGANDASGHYVRVQPWSAAFDDRHGYVRR